MTSKIEGISAETMDSLLLIGIAAQKDKHFQRAFFVPQRTRCIITALLASGDVVTKASLNLSDDIASCYESAIGSAIHHLQEGRNEEALSRLLHYRERIQKLWPQYADFAALGEVVLRKDVERKNQECADCHAVFSIGPKDIVCRDCARKEPVLQKVGFTCERTQERHTYTDMTDFIMAFLTIKKERDEAKEREVVLRKDVEELVGRAKSALREAAPYSNYHWLDEALAKFTTKQEA